MFKLDFQTITELKIVGKSFSILYFNFNFFIIFPQNLSGQTWGAAYLWVQLIYWCLRYVIFCIYVMV